LFIPPFRAAIDHARHPSGDSGLRAAVAFVKSNQREGDAIYSHYTQKEAFEYYAIRYHLKPEDYLAGAYPEENSDEGVLESYNKVAEQFQTRARLWGVFTYVRSRERFKDELFDSVLKQTRECQAVSEFQKTSVYLYTLLKP
jgi:hypothetical protein